MKYLVEVTVTEYKVIEVEANNADEAHYKADQMLCDGMVVFDNAEYADVNIQVQSEVKA